MPQALTAATWELSFDVNLALPAHLLEHGLGEDLAAGLVLTPTIESPRWGRAVARITDEHITLTFERDPEVPLWSGPADLLDNPAHRQRLITQMRDIPNLEALYVLVRGCTE